jgi:2,3-bisphosphoglycerate-independent phosphoglycerate mutase
MNTTPALLVILDGFGCCEEIDGNAIALANKPNWDKLLQTRPHTTISALEYPWGCQLDKWATLRQGT